MSGRRLLALAAFFAVSAFCAEFLSNADFRELKDGVPVGWQFQQNASNPAFAVEDDGEGNYTLHVAGNPSAGSRTAQLVIMPVKGGAGTACTSGFKFNITQSGV